MRISLLCFICTLKLFLTVLFLTCVSPRENICNSNALGWTLYIYIHSHAEHTLTENSKEGARTEALAFVTLTK